MSSIQDLLNEFTEFKSHFKRFPHDDKLIARTIELIDDLQNSQFDSEANELSDILLGFGDRILPMLKLKSRDPGFINYFSFVILPKCNTDLIEKLKPELWKVVEYNDFTEHTDINMIAALNKNGLYSHELKELITAKRIQVRNNPDRTIKNETILKQYLNELQQL